MLLISFGLALIRPDSRCRYTNKWAYISVSGYLNTYLFFCQTSEEGIARTPAPAHGSSLSPACPEVLRLTTVIGPLMVSCSNWLFQPRTRSDNDVVVGVVSPSPNGTCCYCHAPNASGSSTSIRTASISTLPLLSTLVWWVFHSKFLRISA